MTKGRERHNIGAVRQNRGKAMTMATDPTGLLKEALFEYKNALTDEEDIKELKDKTIEWWDKFNKRYVKSYPYPSMTFKIRGNFLRFIIIILF